MKQGEGPLQGSLRQLELSVYTRNVSCDGIVMLGLRIRTNLWMLIGAALFLVLVLVILRFNQYGQTAAREALQAKRLELVTQTRLALASASEAEKSAVMAVTDEDSVGYAAQARAATTQTESVRRQLQLALSQDGNADEKDLFTQFSQAFAEFQRIDDDLLALAVKNTNIKAYNLAFGPAQQLVDNMNGALSKIVAKSAAWPEFRNTAMLALGAEAAVLRIQALLAPHIAEESDQKMDELEALMNGHAREVQKNLEGLAAYPKLAADAELETATASFQRYGTIKSQILALSRENTNVRSLAISLTQKRKAMLACQETLAALQQAISDEAQGSESHARPPSPR